MELQKVKFTPKLTTKELKLDFDFHNPKLERWTLCKGIIAKRGFIFHKLNVIVEGVKIFQTKNGFHVYVYLKDEIKFEKALFMQAVLGSDYKRETFNYERFENGWGEEGNVLFSQKFDANNKEISQEVPKPEYAAEILQAWLNTSEVKKV